MSAEAVVVEVGDFDFDGVLDESFARPVIVDFYAPWCGPCQALGPLLEKLVTERNGAMLLAKVNTDENPQLAASFRISSIPAVRVLLQGRIVAHFQGLRPEAELRALLDELGPSSGSPEQEQEDATSDLQGQPKRSPQAELERTNPAEAEQHYRQQIQENSEAAEPRLALARLLLDRGETGELTELLALVGSEGVAGSEAEKLLSRKFFLEKSRELPAETELRAQVIAEEKAALPRYELGCLLAHQGQAREALQLLLSAGERDFVLAGKQVREAMVKVFYLIGVNDPLANEYRTLLARLLY